MLRIAAVILFVTGLAAQDIAKHPNLGAVPLYFEENKGQTDAHARYIARASGLVGFVLQDGWTLSLSDRPISMHIAGVDSKALLVPEGSVEGITNYYRGTRAITNLQHYSSVRAKNIRPGVDIVYHGNQGELEYDLVVRRGADVNALRLRFEGSRPVLADNGDIVLKNGAGEVRQHKPRVWQEAKGERTEVECRYSLLESSEVGFVLSNYDRSAELTIDPIISYSTHLGGTNKDLVAGIAADGGGNAYVTGSTYSLSDFPVTSGTYHGDQDVFVAKLNPSGTAYVYFTFIGGNSADVPAGIATDGAGNAYVTGRTISPDFPVTVNHFAPGQHAFVVKLGSTGNIVYSTALGGTGDDAGSAIAVDASGSVYVAGSTTSANFPVTAGSYQMTPGGGSDAFAAKLSPTGQIFYATYLGGSQNDYATAIAADAQGNAYVGGNTASANFPTTPGAFSTTFGGNLFGAYDAFVVKLNPGGSSLLYATYLGGTETEYLSGLALDAAGNCYVTGHTQSHSFPTTPGAFSRVKRLDAPVDTGFVTKLSPAGTSLVYSTFLDGGGFESGVGIAVDSTGSAYVLGNTNTFDFPTTPGALKVVAVPSTCCDNDLFLTKVAADGASLAYSTDFGSIFAEYANGVALDGLGGVYIAAWTNGPIYPTTAGAYKTTTPNIGGAMVVTKIDFNSPTLCYPSLFPTSQSVPDYGGDFSASLTLAPGCPWIAVPQGNIDVGYTSFGIISTSPFTFRGTANASPIGSVETFYFGTATFTLTKRTGTCQEPMISPNELRFIMTEESRDVGLALPHSCAWTAISGAPWLVVSKNPSGVGPATITVSVAANNFAERTTTLTIAGRSITVTQSAPPPIMSLSRTVLNFNPGLNGVATSPQTVTVSFTYGANVMWTAVSDKTNIVVTPGSGTGNGSFQVSASPGQTVGRITVTAFGAFSSPATVVVFIYQPPGDSLFGNFDTPITNSVVAGAIPVTGWALDNVEVAKVDIWRESGNALVYIGDAVFVEGARPDVDTLYYYIPFSYRAGWGYQILTNFLPNGNGTFKLHAIAHGKGGNSADLGTKTIVVDNAHASKPFGTIDTPSQGGAASGNAFVNFGWALTQNPNKIPFDGSTITVVIDGQPMGHATYNQFRSDIASLFPGLMNSGGAAGFFYVDTTKLTNGVHTISWNVFDTAGHGDGIGSRYFNVFNSGSGSIAEPEQPMEEPLPTVAARKEKPVTEPRPQGAVPRTLEIEEVGQLEVPLNAIRGYQLVNGEHRPLPIGSSLNRGVFYWQPGPGFLGEYYLVFDHNDGTESHLRVKIRAKTYRPPHVQN